MSQRAGGFGTGVAVLAGDGIGPEVVAEARKAAEAAGARFGFGLDCGRLRPRRPTATCAPARSCPTPCSTSWREARRDPARRRRHARRAPGRPRAGPPAAAPLRARPLRQPAAGQAATPACRPRWPARARTTSTCVVVRENTEGAYAGAGGFLRKGTPGRGRHPGSHQHRARGRALRPVRLRPGPPPARRTADAVPQDQRADLRRRPVAAGFQRGGRRLPRRRTGLRPRRRRLPVPGQRPSAST